MFDEADLNFNVEVINAAWPRWWSFEETNLIKERLLQFEPDLFIAFDGAGDIIQDKLNVEGASAIHWKDRWVEICDIGKQKSFETIIILQPMINTGNKILTEYEYHYYLKMENSNFLEKYPSYAEQLDILNDHCTLALDLRNLFDNVREPIFYDEYHTGPLGNQIIAKKFFAVSLPIVLSTHSNTILNDDSNTSNEEINNKIISNSIDSFSDEFIQTMKNIISPYKTPKIIPLIFE